MLIGAWAGVKQQARAKVETMLIGALELLQCHLLRTFVANLYFMPQFVYLLQGEVSLLIEPPARPLAQGVRDLHAVLGVAVHH